MLKFLLGLTMDQRDFQKLAHAINGLDDCVPPTHMRRTRALVWWWWRYTEGWRFRRHLPGRVSIKEVR